jgi:hypothetical protein
MKNKLSLEERLSVLKGDKNDGIRYIANLDRHGYLKMIERGIRELSNQERDEMPLNLSQLIVQAFEDGKKYAATTPVNQ